MQRITNPAKLAEYRRAQIPTEYRDICQHIRCKLGDAEAWTWTDSSGRPRAVGFLGRAQNGWRWGQPAAFGSVYFRHADARRAWLGELFARAQRIAQSSATRRAAKAEQRAKPHPLQVGDILRASWGYDQTNIDYYEVTRLVGAQMVEVREIAARAQETGFMSGDSVPAPGQYIGEAKRRRVSDYGERDSIKVHECAHAYLIRPTVVGGVKCYGPSHWSAYA